ncbi:MAG TPA: ATP-binding protein [Lacibacter sp.]|nr:ATP-binding protein [Lacibacter sp.]HMO88608.1 ATP-binding protein [Lacibacter sp.]HMP85962.1 ATP-binding protein [Lacibacter sp.]
MATSSSRARPVQFARWFWILLTYVIAALIWWFISLERQNTQMSTLRLQQLNPQHPAYAQQVGQVLTEKKRNTTKHVSEGITFLALILVGAVFVYRAIRKQMEYAALQRNFMMAITHELKTPIATTRLSIETLLRRKLDAPQQEKLLQNALSETNRLNILTNNILLASQLEEKTFQRNHDDVDLGTITSTVVQDYRNRYPGRTIQAGLEQVPLVEGDPLLLEIALSNLLDNALKYAPRESTVQVSLAPVAAGIRLEVQDAGSGIPDSEKEKIFDKFYRGGNEITRKTKGTGLGLYLTKKIIAHHKGDIFVTDNSSGGSTFVVQFPST